MKSIVRRENGDDWREYVRKLYEAEMGESDPDDEELRRFDASTGSGRTIKSPTKTGSARTIPTPASGG